MGRATAVIAVLVSVGCGTGGTDPSLRFDGDATTSRPGLDRERPPCDENADCANLETAPCQRAVCGSEGRCRTTAKDDGISCDDGNPCTSEDACEGGVCRGGTNECACDEDADCAEHDDGNPCNGTLACIEGECRVEPGSVVSCGGSSGACRVATCDPDTGECVEEPRPDGTPCDDGNACTTGDTCQDGSCASGSQRSCETDDPCLEGSCDPDEGCVTEPAEDGTLCSDGNPCTRQDSCVDGTCVGGETACPCDTDADCEAFDVDLCDAPLVCNDDGTCAPSSGSGVSCEDPDDPCLVAECDPETGECVEQPAPDGTACGQGAGCASEATCQDGACEVPDGVCDDGNPCTEDVCDPVKGCGHTPIDGGVCDDGNPCTSNDHCEQGQCVGEGSCECETDEDCSGEGFDPCLGEWTCNQGTCEPKPGTAPDCSDTPTGPCSEAVCNPDTGACETSQLPDGTACDDGDPCTKETTCQAGSCQGGTPKSCDDDNPCTDDTCVPGEGCEHTFNNAPCDDGNACTKNDTCVQGGCYGGSAVDCSSEDPCLTASCDPEEGCVTEPAADGTACDDGSDCTVDDHCEGGECVGTNTCECTEDEDCPDDGNPCTGTLVCDDNSCTTEPGSAVECDDPGPCATASCDPDTGECVTEPANEGEACQNTGPCETSGTCEGGECVGEPVDCDDGNPCTEDVCDPETGTCEHTPDDGAACDDGDPCTENDFCDGEVCTGDPVDCDDGDPCTETGCEPGQGCTSEPVDCDDGDACTTDTCDPDQGGCVHEPKSCDDGNACTDDSCDPATGACQHETKDCDDGDACTTDTCDPATGACQHEPKDCDDGDPCTDDSCDPATGACQHEPITCDDGDPCTTNACDSSEGGCVHEPKDCDDGDPCTEDSCEPEEGGCVHEPNTDCVVEGCGDKQPGDACDDGVKATAADLCIDGSCAGFTRNVAPDSSETGHRAFRRIDRAFDRWFVAERREGQPDGDEGALVTLDGDSASVYADTVGDWRFVELHRGYAVDGQGHLWRFDPDAADDGGWDKDHPLEEALQSSGTALPNDLWASAEPEEDDSPLVWVIGRDAQNQVWIRRCGPITGSGEGDAVNCFAESMAQSPDDDPLPRAITGTGTCDSLPCSGLDPVLGADVSSGATNADGTPLYFNDAYQRSGSPGGPDWSVAFFDTGAQASRVQDAVSLGGGRYLVIGSVGHLRHRWSDGSWTYEPGEPSDLKFPLSELNPTERRFMGGWTGTDLLFLAATRQDAGGERVLELWTLRLDAPPQEPDSWRIHELDTVSGTGAGLFDVHGSGDDVLRAVGSGEVDGGQSDGLIYTRQAP